MLWAFQEGGLTMWWVLATDLVAATAIVVAFALAVAAYRAHAVVGLGRVVAGVALLFAFAPLAVGGAGYLYGMQMVDAAVANADVQHREMLQARGKREAMNNVVFGGASSGLCVLLALVPLGVAVAARRAPEGGATSS